MNEYVQARVILIADGKERRLPGKYPNMKRLMFGPPVAGTLAVLFDDIGDRNDNAGTVEIWDVANLRRLVRQDAYLTAFAFSPDGKKFATVHGERHRPWFTTVRAVRMPPTRRR